MLTVKRAAVKVVMVLQKQICCSAVSKLIDCTAGFTPGKHKFKVANIFHFFAVLFLYRTVKGHNNRDLIIKGSDRRGQSAHNIAKSAAGSKWSRLARCV